MSAGRSRALRFTAAALVLAVGAAVMLVVASPGRGHASSSTPAPSPPAVELHAVHGASYIPALEGKRPLFILALGSDSRPGQGAETQRTDAIHLIGVNLKTHSATILDFPRDSWVNIPGHGVNKINSALSFGGPPMTVQTIEDLTGIRIDFWLLTTFDGLKNMVNGIGGLTVKVATAMHDPYSGANFSAGVHHMDGSQALSFARDRHSFVNGDLTRTINQGTLLISALTKLHAQFAKDPASVLDWIATMYHNIYTNVPVSTLFKLALTATQVPVSHVNNIEVPATAGVVGAADVVFIQPGAKAIYAQMRADGTAG